MRSNVKQSDYEVRNGKAYITETIETEATPKDVEQALANLRENRTKIQNDIKTLTMRLEKVEEEEKKYEQIRRELQPTPKEG